MIVNKISSRTELIEKVLKNNPGWIIIKFGADWCGPCKKIHPYIEEKKQTIPDNVIFYDLNVDDNMDVYSFFKFNKMVNGIPALLAYRQGNLTPFSDSCVIGTNQRELDHFFETIYDQSCKN